MKKMREGFKISAAIHKSENFVTKIYFIVRSCRVCARVYVSNRRLSGINKKICLWWTARERETLSLILI